MRSADATPGKMRGCSPSRGDHWMASARPRSARLRCARRRASGSTGSSTIRTPRRSSRSHHRSFRMSPRSPITTISPRSSKRGSAASRSVRGSSTSTSRRRARLDVARSCSWPPASTPEPSVCTCPTTCACSNSTSPNCSRSRSACSQPRTRHPGVIVASFPLTFVRTGPHRCAAAGFEPGRLTTWVAEGLLGYLSRVEPSACSLSCVTSPPAAADCRSIATSPTRARPSIAHATWRARKRWRRCGKAASVKTPPRGSASTDGTLCRPVERPSRWRATGCWAIRRAAF